MTGGKTFEELMNMKADDTGKADDTVKAVESVDRTPARCLPHPAEPRP